MYVLENPDIVPTLDCGHGLRSDEDELSAHRATSSLHHHFHTDFSIRVVHEDIATSIALVESVVGRSRAKICGDLQFIQASDRGTHCFPDREQETYRGE